MSSHFLLLQDNFPDDSDLGRARSMTNTLAQKANISGAIVPFNAINNEFAQVVHRLRTIQEEWTKRRTRRHVPIITLKHSDPNEVNHSNPQHEIQALRAEKKQLAITVSSLFQELQHLKQQNQNMAHCVESLRKVLHESKTYILSLKHRNDNLASDMDFQDDLHEKQRRVWKTKIRDTDVQHTIPSASQAMYSHSLQASDNVLHITDAHDLDTILSEYETVIEKQREQIKYKNEQLDQQRNVFEHEKNQQIAELSNEINHLKNQKQQEMEALHMKITQTNTIIERAKAENRRLHKTLQVTNNELNANRKLMEASRPLNGTQTEQQLFQLEQDYLNLSEVLVACQHRVGRMENELDAKQHELNDSNRLIDEQNKRMEEYKKDMALLQANLAESKSDQSDLIEALQQEWEQCKEEVMRYKQKCRQLQHEKDELMAQNMNMQFQQNGNHQNNQNNQNENGAELVVLIDDLERKLQQKDAEVKSQEMLMAQLMEQQRAFQKRNKTLVARLKAMKSQSNQFHVAHRGGHNHPPHGHRSSSNKFFEGNQQQKVLQMPDSVSIELKSVYDHYLRNPMLSGAVADVLHQIQSMSSRIVDKHGANDYRLPEFGGRLRINSAQTILVVMEDILVQRQRAIAAESEAIEAILCLKEEHERSQNHLGMEKKRLAGDIRKLTNQLTKYVSQIRELVKEMELEIERSTQENGNSMNLKEKEEDL
eukprot:1042771_1